MQVVLLRVGIDTGSGGILGPLFRDGSFEFIPIPDRFKGRGLDTRTYGNTRGRRRKRLVDYFHPKRRKRLFHQPLHFDPEFRTYTYGDPTPPKGSLRRLGPGDLLVFYAGLKGWDHECPPALYVIGYFEVTRAGRATDFTGSELRRLFRNNFHFMHRTVFADQGEQLVLVKGGRNSRLLKRAVRISILGKDRSGRPLHRLSPEARKKFGNFGGHTGIQRCPPRWVAPNWATRAARFVRSLE